jgi:transcriptional regulator with XRE-family HTH domain
MNQIERLRDDLVGRFPDLAVELDAPADACGPWFLDVPRPGGLAPVVVEWRPDRGFGVSTPGGDDFGSGPDEVYPNARAALDRVVRLVLSGGPTEPPQAVRLAELRQLRGLSQGELAERAGVGQANVSRIEGRADFKVSTLARVVAALGGSLVLLARFPDGTERELQVGGRPGSPTAEGAPRKARRRRGTGQRRRRPGAGTAVVP